MDIDNYYLELFLLDKITYIKEIAIKAIIPEIALIKNINITEQITA